MHPGAGRISLACQRLPNIRLPLIGPAIRLANGKNEHLPSLDGLATDFPPFKELLAFRIFFGCSGSDLAASEDGLSDLEELFSQDFWFPGVFGCSAFAGAQSAWNACGQSFSSKGFGAELAHTLHMS